MKISKLIIVLSVLFVMIFEKRLVASCSKSFEDSYFDEPLLSELIRSTGQISIKVPFQVLGKENTKTVFPKPVEIIDSLEDTQDLKNQKQTISIFVPFKSATNSHHPDTHIDLDRVVPLNLSGTISTFNPRVVERSRQTIPLIVRTDRSETAIPKVTYSTPEELFFKLAVWSHAYKVENEGVKVPRIGDLLVLKDAELSPRPSWGTLVRGKNLEHFYRKPNSQKGVGTENVSFTNTGPNFYFAYESSRERDVIYDDVKLSLISSSSALAFRSKSSLSGKGKDFWYFSNRKTEEVITTWGLESDGIPVNMKARLILGDFVKTFTPEKLHPQFIVISNTIAAPIYFDESPGVSELIGRLTIKNRQLQSNQDRELSPISWLEISLDWSGNIDKIFEIRKSEIFGWLTELTELVSAENLVLSEEELLQHQIREWRSQRMGEYP